MAIGFRILKRRQKVDPAKAARFLALPVANISDMMGRMTAGGARLRPMHAGGSMAGPAFTVKTRPGDNLMVHKALNIAEPGDIVVVDAGGDLTNAIIGELMLRFAAKRGLGGVVIDGAVRDSGFIRANRFPVYAAGVTHRGPYKDGPGEINVPIALDGMVIEPGDLIVGDDDGVLCIPYGQVDALHDLTQEKFAGEQTLIEQINAGTSNRAQWDKRVVDLGCEIES